MRHGRTEVEATRESTLKVMQAVRRRIKKGWCADYYAVDELGRGCNPSDKSAVRFSIVGAFLRICRLGSPGDYRRELYISYDFLRRSSHEGNRRDKTETSQEAALEIMDRAIALARITPEKLRLTACATDDTELRSYLRLMAELEDAFNAEWFHSSGTD